MGQNYWKLLSHVCVCLGETFTPSVTTHIRLKYRTESSMMAIESLFFSLSLVVGFGQLWNFFVNMFGVVATGDECVQCWKLGAWAIMVAPSDSINLKQFCLRVIFLITVPHAQMPTHAHCLCPARYRAYGCWRVSCVIRQCRPNHNNNNNNVSSFGL